MASYENKKIRSRGENWTQEEKDLFIDVMAESSRIIENKMSDTNTNKRKNMEWIKVQNKLRELTGKQRDLAQLKGYWRRAKLGAKKSVSQHRKSIKATGGGVEGPPSPPPEDLKILALCPTDFVVDENIYDSDAVSQLTGQENAPVLDEEPLNSTLNENINNSTIFDIEDQIDNNDRLGDAYVEEIITTKNVHSDEIDVHLIDMKGEKKHITKEDRKMDPKKIETPKKKLTNKAALVESNMEIKKRATHMMEEEHLLKIKYQKQELAHQQSRHKLEIDILLLEKEKKKLELEILKNKRC